MKRFLTLLLCLTMLVSMAALPATSLAEETVELTFYYPVGVGGDLALLIENLAAEFTKENPNIIINPVFCGNSTETTTKTIAAIQGGNAPDFAILGNSELYSMLSLEAIIPLDDLIAADEDGQEYIDDFWPAFLQNSYYDGHIYSIPFQRSTIIMYYNKDAFRAAGLDPEMPPTTWEELADYAQTFLPALVPCLHLRHLGVVLRFRVRAQRTNGGGHDVAEAPGVADIALALHAEAGDAVPRELRQQHTAHALHEEGEARMLQHTLMAHGHHPLHESPLILFLYSSQEPVHIASGIAQACAQRGQGLRFQGMPDQHHALASLRHASSPPIQQLNILFYRIGAPMSNNSAILPVWPVR